MQNRKNRFGQKEKPTPINAVEKAIYAGFFIGADRIPFFCTRKKLSGYLGAGAWSQ